MLMFLIFLIFLIVGQGILRDLEFSSEKNHFILNVTQSKLKIL